MTQKRIGFIQRNKKRPEKLLKNTNWTKGLLQLRRKQNESK